MADGGNLFVVRVSDGETTGPLGGSRGDVEFPSEVRGWSDVLDCRHPPYTEKDIAALRHYGVHVNKLFLLVPEATIKAPALAAAPEVSTLPEESAEE